MENTENKVLNIVYLGSAPDTLSCLEKSGKFNITQLDTAIEVVNYLRSSPAFDGIISETHLPGVDGVEAFHFLLERNVSIGKPFILIAHHEEPEMKLQAHNSDIYDYYQTPLDINRIYKRIRYFDTHIANIPLGDLPPPDKTYKTPFIKRLFDITMAGGALLLLSPLLLLVIIAIKLESRGPFYYVSKRVGANFKEFGFYKLRSMRAGADKQQKELSHLNQYVTKIEDECPDCALLPDGQFCCPTTLFIHGEEICEKFSNKKRKKTAFLKLENDPRITKVGKFIRNTSIDELPQLINIIKGDMSVVGNRPLPVDEAVELTRNGNVAKRYAAAAGLTGLWQVELRGQGGVMSEETRFDLDAEYAVNNTFMGDMKLIFRTLKIFIQPGNV